MNYGKLTHTSTIQLEEQDKGFRVANIEKHELDTDKYLFMFDVDICQSFVIDRGDYATPDSSTETGLSIDIYNVCCLDIYTDEEITISDEMIEFLKTNISYE